MARIPWQFHVGSETYDLPVNPNEASMPSTQKRLTHQPTSAGKQITFQGKKMVGEISFSGDILEEEQYRSFEDWFSKSKQIRITDDLGQVYWVVLTSFNPTRVRDVDYPWHMTYSAQGTVLNRGAI